MHFTRICRMCQGVLNNICSQCYHSRCRIPPSTIQETIFLSQAKISSNASRVFLSLPSQRTIDQQAHLERFTKMLEEHNIFAEELPRSEYPRFGQLSEVRRRISGCSGAAIFGFSRPQGNEDIPAPSDAKSATIQQHLTPTPWNHIEAGIAFVLDLPLLVMLLREFNQEILIKLYQSSLCSDFCLTATGR